MSSGAEASVTAVIAAAGSGKRLGAGGPKAFVPVAGRPMVEWSIAAMRAAPSVGAIVVAVPPGETGHTLGPDETVHTLGRGDMAEGGEGAELQVVEGGGTRSESVANALEAVDTDLVAIHDAARPLVTPALIEEVIATLVLDPDAAGAIAATPVTDTIKLAGRRVASDAPHAVHQTPLEVLETTNREMLWAAQTPQAFRVEALRAALGAGAGEEGTATDEAMLVEAVSGRVLIHPAPADNIKVTTPLDLRLAELFLA